ncbi:MAG TPA: hypothetical protein PKZ20_17165 [Rhodocyclaceae bacterium]|nr:hypothetical protein [Rhodocyclaceae bacterium]HNF63465.1 hypothetical protein [Rhodocyclaceae bacterium]
MAKVSHKRQPRRLQKRLKTRHGIDRHATSIFNVFVRFLYTKPLFLKINFLDALRKPHQIAIFSKREHPGTNNANFCHTTPIVHVWLNKHPGDSP